MRVFAIGDIHGCLNELESMFRKIDAIIKPGDIIVCIGDYIDRGPNSKGVVDLLIKRKATMPYNHVYLKGNHEDMLISGTPGWMLNGAIETLDSYGVDPRKGVMPFVPMLSLPPEHQEFYRSLVINFTVGKYVFVHAGIDPGLSLSEQSEIGMLWNRDFVGYMGDYKDGHKVVFGHTPLKTPVIRANQFGIDTGCCFDGGYLTCLVVDIETDEYEFLISRRGEK